MMEIGEIFKLVAANGVWAVLFLFMLIYELKDSRSREIKYQKTIDDLAERLIVVNEIKEEVEKLSGNNYIISASAAKKSPPSKLKES